MLTEAEDEELSPTLEPIPLPIPLPWLRGSPCDGPSCGVLHREPQGGNTLSCTQPAPVGLCLMGSGYCSDYKCKNIAKSKIRCYSSKDSLLYRGKQQSSDRIRLKLHFLASKHLSEVFLRHDSSR